MAPPLAPAVALYTREAFNGFHEFRLSLGAAGVAKFVAGEGGATPPKDGQPRPGSAQRGRHVGSLPLRPQRKVGPLASRASIVNEALATNHRRHELRPRPGLKERSCH